MRGAVSKGGGNASLADEILVGGQGVWSDPESEGFEEKYRVVIDWGRPLMNRSAKDGIRSSPHYGGEGATHSPSYQGVCWRHDTEDSCVTPGDLSVSWRIIWSERRSCMYGSPPPIRFST